MKREVRRSSACNRDVVEIATYLSKQNLAAAQKFLDAFDDLCDILAQLPDVGQEFPTSKPNLTGLRIVALPKFRSYVAFHRSVQGDIEIARVVYGGRDLKAVIEEE